MSFPSGLFTAMVLGAIGLAVLAAVLLPVLFARDVTRRSIW